MQTCYNCGKEVDDNVLICPECGALVKRYGKPARDAEAEPAQTPAACAERADAGGRCYVVRDETGRLRVRGFLKTLCIVCIIADLYLSFSQFFVLWLSGSGSFFQTMLDEYAAAGAEASILDMLNFTVDFVAGNRIFVIFLGSAFALKAACLIWFLVCKRRLSLYVAGGAAIAIVAVFLFSGSGIAAFEYCLDVLAVMLLVLRRDWNTLPK